MRVVKSKDIYNAYSADISFLLRMRGQPMNQTRPHARSPTGFLEIDARNDLTTEAFIRSVAGHWCAWIIILT